MVITFQEWTAVTLEPIFIASVAIIWFLPLLIYLIIAVSKKGKSPSGRTISKPMIAYGNTWIAFGIWGLGSLFLYLLLIYPIWLKFFS